MAGYYLRELENEGYIPDTQLRTVYVKAGMIATAEYPTTGQIQIVSSPPTTPTNRTAPATPPAGLFEIDDSGYWSTYRSDSQGRPGAELRPSPAQLPRRPRPAIMTGMTESTAIFDMREISAKFRGDEELMDGELITNWPKEMMAGQRYAIPSGIANSSNVRLDNFYWRDTLPAEVRLDTVVTGTYNFPGTYKITYRVNGGEYRTWGRQPVHQQELHPGCLGHRTGRFCQQ